jgi:Cdc6-like AAA superfamily ATPase
VGVDLLRRAGYLAESEASRKITVKQVNDAFERWSKNLSLGKTLRSLSEDEKKLLKMIADSPDSTSGDAYETLREKTGIGVKKYNEMMAKLEHLRLVDTNYVAGVKGRSRKITLRHEPKDILESIKKK